MIRFWFKSKFVAFSRIDKQPPRPIAWLSATLTRFGVAAHISDKLGLLLRFLYVNSFQFESINHDSPAPSTIEILFVAARKDFRTLELAINGAIETCRQEISGISIVVPDQDLAHCKATISSCTSSGIEIKIKSESSVINEPLVNLIFSHFGARGGWVLQQILKLEYVRSSRSAGVLIIDADTILLKHRTWLTPDGIQTLMPSWEYHRPYFDFLSNLPPFINSKSPYIPKFSFVTHHMLMQPDIVNDIYRACNWNDTKNLVDYVCQYSNTTSQSPISIDYELYGHFLVLNHSEKVNLVKWGNASAVYTENVSIEVLRDEFSDFASISLHTYLE